MKATLFILETKSVIYPQVGIKKVLFQNYHMYFFMKKKDTIIP